MGKKKKSQRNKTKRRNTSLSGHQRAGKTLQPPFNTIANTRLVPWLRDQFPDYLWVCSLLEAELDRGRSTIVATFKLVNEVLDDTLETKSNERPIFDGSLTSWEAIPQIARKPILDAFVDRQVHDLVLPEEFAQTLGMYPQAPGSWIIQRWPERPEFRVDPERAEQGLARVIIASAIGRDTVPTNAKALNLSAVMTAEKISFAHDLETINLLGDWPNDLDDDERSRIESFIRATFGATSTLVLDEEGSRRLIWAKQFWRSNWKLYPCRIAGDAPDQFDLSSLDGEVARFADRVNELWSSFESAALSSDPDLYDTDRYEVLTGITARALRIASSAIHSPSQWTLEHSAASMRALVEALIILTWLTNREDPDMYERFKDYGRGRVKLLKLHWEEFADTLDEVPTEVAAQIEDLNRFVNQDIDEEFQSIDLGGTFSGIDTRKMAYEVGLEREYRLAFAPSSSDTHGEWGHLDRYVLTRCVNATHRWHRIPRQDITPAVRPQVMTTMLEITGRIVERLQLALLAKPTSDEPVPEPNLDNQKETDIADSEPSRASPRIEDNPEEADS